MELLFLTWSEDFAVGHKELDAEHQQLVEVINEICAAEYAKFPSSALSILLNTLKLAVVAHFKHENTVIREFSDSASRSENSTSSLAKYLSVDAIGEHCAQHAEALLALEAVILSGDSQADSGQRQLGRKLVEWFIDHAINHDAELKELFEGYFTNLAQRLA
jgi:hemerythrin